MKTTKITIVVANYSWFEKRPWNEPTLSVPILTAILKDKCQLSLIDANAYNMTSQEVLNKIHEISPTVILITGLSSEYFMAYHEIARLAKEYNEDCIVIMGGVYPTVSYEYVIEDPNVDYAIMGHAEERLDKLIQLILSENEAAIEQFDGLAYRRDGINHIRPVTSYIGDVEEMVRPDYSLMDLEQYIGYQDMRVANFNASTNKRNMNIMTSYGCPNNCLFCATRTISGRKTAFKKVEDVLDEIDYFVKEYHVESITFQDDSILTDKKRAAHIFQAVIDRKYNIELKVVTLAAWHLDEDILKLMKKAGFTRIGIAIESGCERVLHKVIRKPLKLEIIPNLVRLFRKYDILMTADFIIGFPGEKWEEIRQTFKFAEECDIDLCMFHIATVLPKTDLYYLALENDCLPKDFSFYNDGTNFGFCKGSITTEEFTPQELMVLRAYEWDRINFATPEKRKRACRLMEITEEQLEIHRRNTRRSLGTYV